MHSQTALDYQLLEYLEPQSHFEFNNIAPKSATVDYHMTLAYHETTELRCVRSMNNHYDDWNTYFDSIFHGVDASRGSWAPTRCNTQTYED
jgi:hypothetical protein